MRTMEKLLALGMVAGCLGTWIPSNALAATLEVGPGKTYATPCAAIAAAGPGDVIEVDASGNYDGDHCSWSTDNLTVRGVNGRAKIDALGDPANVAEHKGIFVIHAPDATIENFELAGAAVSSTDGSNGAGIRHQGTNLTVRNCFFHDDQDGILGSPIDAGTGTVTIESSEFADNGAGDGQSHNMYLGHYAKFILRYSYSHGAKLGHLVKSRALENIVEYNRLTDEAGTTASYELSFPNAGLSYVIGNVIEQSDASDNGAIIDYDSEPSTANPDTRLFVVNNTVVNDRAAGGIFVADHASTPAVITNDIFVGKGTVCSQTDAVSTTNFTSGMGDPLLADVSSYDYHLLPGSPCIDQGTDPGDGAGQSLAPTEVYVHPLRHAARPVVGALDIGAYEFGTQPDAGVSDGADAGTSDGGTSDAGVPDAGTESPGPVAGGGPGDVATGCGCQAGSSGASGLILLALALLGLSASVGRGKKYR